MGVLPLCKGVVDVFFRPTPQSAGRVNQLELSLLKSDTRFEGFSKSGKVDYLV